MISWSSIPCSVQKRRSRAFTLVEIMVVVVIIGLLAAMALPLYRHVTIRSKATALENDLRAFSTAFITYNLQNGKWPENGTTKEIPVEMAGALPVAFTAKSPIGGYYKWNYDVSADGLPNIKAAIVIETDSDSVVSSDEDLRLLIDRQMDDGDLDSGNILRGSTASLVFIIEK